MKQPKGDLLGYVVLSDDQIGLCIPQELIVPENARRGESILQHTERCVTIFDSRADAKAAIKRTVEYYRYFNPEEAQWYQQTCTVDEARREVKS